MNGDPAQFFTEKHSEKVRKEALDCLEALLRPTFGDLWTSVAADKSTAHLVQTLARARTASERESLLVKLRNHHGNETISVISVQSMHRDIWIVTPSKSGTSVRRFSSDLRTKGTSSARTEEFEFA